MPTDRTRRLANHDPGVPYSELKSIGILGRRSIPLPPSFTKFFETAWSIKDKCHVEHS